MRDLAMQRGIMWQLWMWIYRIRRVCCRKCIELLLNHGPDYRIDISEAI